MPGSCHSNNPSDPLLAAPLKSNKSQDCNNKMLQTTKKKVLKGIAGSVRDDFPGSHSSGVQRSHPKFQQLTGSCTRTQDDDFKDKSNQTHGDNFCGTMIEI
jgi:hypothetical protein